MTMKLAIQYRAPSYNTGPIIRGSASNQTAPWGTFSQTWLLYTGLSRGARRQPNTYSKPHSRKATKEFTSWGNRSCNRKWGQIELQETQIIDGGCNQLECLSVDSFSLWDNGELLDHSWILSFRRESLFSVISRCLHCSPFQSLVHGSLQLSTVVRANPEWGPLCLITDDDS